MKITLKLFIFIPLLFLALEAQAEKKANVLSPLKYKSGEEKQNDIRALQTELLISKSEKKAIEQISKLLRKYKGTPMEPDLLFRLAELHMRRAKADRFFEIHRQSETIVNLAPRRVKKASSLRQVKKAISVYDAIERRFPRYSELDLVIFNNAFARQGIGQTKSAEKRYRRLVKDFPDSLLVPDSHLAIGEMAFVQGRFEVALKEFNSIKNYPQSRVYPYGIYKAAWSRYNLHDAKGGLKELEAVVAFGKKVSEQGIDARLDLREEALTDMTLFYEDVYPAANAFDYFSVQAEGKELTPILLRLASLYERHSRFKDKITLLAEMIDRQPLDPQTPDVMDQIVWSYEQMKDRKLAVNQLESFSQLCDESPWKNEQKKEDIESCKKLSRATTLKLAQKWLEIWKKNPTYTAFADSSERAFEIFLKFNGNAPASHKPRYAYAELLFKRNKFRKAIEHYSIVGQSEKNEDLKHSANYAAIVSLEKAVNDKWSQRDENLYTELAKQYSRNHPNGKYLLDVEFKRGIIAYDRKDYNIAEELFLLLGNKYPKQAKGLKAQDLYLDILNSRKDYVTLKKFATQWSEIKGVNKKRVAQLAKIYREAYFLQVQKIEESGDYSAAAAGYRAFARENRNSPLAEKALWNAVQLHFKGGNLIEGAKASEEFYSTYPQSSHSLEALTRAAEAYESMGNVKRSAQLAENLITKDTDSATKWQLLAGDFRYLSGDIEMARKHYWRVADRSSEANKKLALIKLLRLEKAQDSSKELVRVYKAMLAWGQQPFKSQAAVYFLRQTFDSGDDTSAFTEASKIVAMGKDADPAARAEARFVQAQILEKEFRRQSIKSRIDRLTMVLSIKTEKLDKAQRAYQAVIRFGDPKYAVKAMARLADCYDHYVKALREMAIPTGLDKAEEPAFRQELEKLALPMEEKSVETLAEAVAQAKAFEFYDGTAGLLQKKLDQVNMRKSQVPELDLGAPKIMLPVFRTARAEL